MGKFSRLGNDLYSGRKSIDFVGRKWLWYAMSGVIVLLAVAGPVPQGPQHGHRVHRRRAVPRLAGLEPGHPGRTPTSCATRSPARASTAAASPVVTTSGDNAILVQIEPLDHGREQQGRRHDRPGRPGVDPDKAISQDEIGASWGQEVAKRSVTGLVVFLVLVVLFIWAYFRQWKMSVAAIVALAHDLVITVGVYALSGFEVTPATVTGVLTILGFSLYDTVVVFDKVRENTKGLRERRTTYAAEANLAVNQTLVRSINTSIVALIPVGAILYVGAVQLGSGSLKDLALALFVGMAAGAYSSIFIATPLLVQLKASESDVQLAEKRAEARERREADRYAVGARPSPRTCRSRPSRAPQATSTRTSRGRLGRRLAQRPRRSPEAAGRGRVAPPSRGPGPSQRRLGAAAAARGRAKSKRGKK